MMTLPDSNSKPLQHPGYAYERLHQKVQEWIWDQHWEELRATQAMAVSPILEGKSDIIITAATASGKTEAAWLPIISSLAQNIDTGNSQPGVKALYVSPLKALINDQYDRLTELCKYVQLPVNRRHEDVSGSERNTFQTDPDGVLLITPESLEALFVLQGPRIPAVFNGLRYVVVDELHSFVGTERGAQLQSLLHRIELAIRRQIPRVALSATLADSSQAAEFLRPGNGASVTVIDGSKEDRAELLMQLRGYAESDRTQTISQSSEDDESSSRGSLARREIAKHIFENLRGKDNLVFANSRTSVELYTDLLRQLCDEYRVPGEFFAHHGNLSKDHREGVEHRLKSSEQPATAICTSTLEMGIDIGSVDSVAQIGAPGSVSALRQRLGRSGRRGKAATLRLYVTERKADERTPPSDQLRTEIVEAIATIDLLLENWYEPPNLDGLHFSTLIQQLLSVIAQFGGATASALFSALCSNGTFVRVTKAQFVMLLRDLARSDIVVQASDGTLLPGQRGERLLNHYSFFSAFQSPEEYRLVTEGRTLGSIPVTYPILPGSLLIFSGRR
jgi:ATP-dependent Lhr-like helicase